MLHHIGQINGNNIRKSVYALFVDEVKRTVDVVQRYLIHQGESEDKAKERASEYATEILHHKLNDIITKIKFREDLVTLVKDAVIDTDTSYKTNIRKSIE